MTEPVLGADTRAETRERIITVAASLLHEHGAAALTTRGVAQAAGVQAPTIYRLFGDKDGLIDAVAEHVLATFVSTKAAVVESESAASGDPVIDLRNGWDMQIEFGLANPAIFSLLNGPNRSETSPATVAGIEVLRSRVHRVAAAGRLRVSERRAMELIHAAGTGAVFTLLSMAPDKRDPQLGDALYDAVSREILTDAPVITQDETLASAITFRTMVPNLPRLSDGEKALMSEWLGRVIEGPQAPAG